MIRWSNCFRSTIMSLFRIMALDIGERWIGVALSDQEKRIAYPLKVLDRKKSDPIKELKQIILDKKVSKVVIGLPIREDGTHGTQTELVQDFIKQFKERINIETDCYDERYTTVIAKSMSKNLKRKKRQERQDHVAASILLADYLEYNSGQ